LNYRILYIGYWNVDDGLTHATVFPHLEILKNMDNVEYVHFSNTQREQTSEKSIQQIKKLTDSYTPLYSKNLSINHLNKIYDFVYFPRLIKQLIKENGINIIIARGAPAGALAYLATKENKIPFIVESFEPHAAYMKAAGEWKVIDPRYIWQKHWEQKQKKLAQALITVSDNYRLKLLEEDVAKEKLFTVPCAVNPTMFNVNEHFKKEIRRSLKIADTDIVGVYAGKFGGLYLEDEAFLIFKKAFKEFNNFQILLLTSTDKHWIKSKAKKYDLPSNRIHINFVSYDEVNKYLNAADFGLALYKSNSVSPYLSPVKIGEYWAAGLPVVLTPKVGDEMHWIEKEKLGFILSPDHDIPLRELLSASREHISRKGHLIRNPNRVKEVYQEVLV